MIKKAGFVVGLIAVLTFSIHASTNKLQKAEQVDAVTQATLGSAALFTLPIAVTSNSATVEWNEWHSDQGTAVLSWGTNKNSLTKRNVTLSERANMKLVLTGLSPSTTYYLFFEVTDSEHDPYGDTATIKTSKVSGVIQNFALSKNVPLELLDHSVRLGSQVRPGDRLVISDCEGRTLFNHAISGSEGMIALPSIAKGVYVLTHSRQGKMLDKKRIVKGN
jgi:hypothetical protein